VSRTLAELDFRRVRSVMETPIMDERKWAKVPAIPADVVLIDLEDTVVPADKEAARERAVRYLRDPSFFGQRLVIARPNNLSTPWGRDDMVALARAGVRLLLYPKAASVAEVVEVRRLLDELGAAPLLFPAIESGGALFDVREIAQLPGVGGLFTGIGDLSADCGIPFYDVDGEINPVLSRVRDDVALAAAAVRIASTDTVYARDLKNEDDVRAAITDIRRRGYTSAVAFYPPHVALVNELLRPTAGEVADATSIVARYSEAEGEGKPAVALEDGRTVLRLDFLRAQRVLDRATMTVPTRADLG
jgi:citrate lyase beta subunit